jgi:cation diffusion facilitator CzcD-associated flavoprotein CzcO
MAATPVDFAGKRVAVIGTGSSGVQTDPCDRARGCVLDGVSTHRQLVHAAQQLTDHAGRAGTTQGRLRGDARNLELVPRAGSSTFRTIARPSMTTKEERWAFFEKMWNSLGFSKLTSNYTDMMANKAANAEWCEFISEKIRSIVKDPQDS